MCVCVRACVRAGLLYCSPDVLLSWFTAHMMYCSPDVLQAAADKLFSTLVIPPARSPSLWGALLSQKLAVDAVRCRCTVYCHYVLLLYCCTAALLYCCTAVLLLCCTAVLLFVLLLLCRTKELPG